MNIDALVTQASAPVRPQKEAAPVQVSGKPTPAPVETVQSRPAPAPTLDQVRAASEQIERYLKSSGRALDFHVDSDSGLVVVVVRDSASGDVIRQIPSEEALRLAQSLGDGAISLVSAMA